MKAINGQGKILIGHFVITILLYAQTSSFPYIKNVYFISVNDKAKEERKNSFK